MYEERVGSFRPMDYIYLDLPMIHQHTAEGMRFLEALKENKNMDLFNRPSVQVIIDKQWQRWTFFNKYFRAIPIVLQLIAFWIWSNVLLVNEEN